ncbi:hypothetical protein PIB30_077636 [Stylosanthes scabra]|uniref:Uncharacterized protein n=1 Tax=Stylosanthes scabra TaxID=79078 RepID=A0ABU6VQY3_9FABA|nr:hypothetical protein [Stylosanthes scabra]
MGSGIIFYEYEKHEKFEDYDMRADAELGTRSAILRLDRKRFLFHIPCLWTSMWKKDYLRYVKELKRHLELSPLHSRQVSAPDLPRKQLIDSLTVIMLRAMIYLEFGNRHCRVRKCGIPIIGAVDGVKNWGVTLPIGLWCTKNLNRIATLWGKLIKQDDRTKNPKSFTTARVIIDSFQWERIHEWVTLRVDGRCFDVFVKEFGLEVDSV